jgi:hypothetical protein
MEQSKDEQEKPVHIAVQAAIKHGYTPEEAHIGRLPTLLCDVIIVVVTTRSATLHVVLEITLRGGQRVLQTKEVHIGKPKTDDCAMCDEYHSVWFY